MIERYEMHMPPLRRCRYYADAMLFRAMLICCYVFSLAIFLESYYARDCCRDTPLFDTLLVFTPPMPPLCHFSPLTYAPLSVRLYWPLLRAPGWLGTPVIYYWHAHWPHEGQ